MYISNLVHTERFWNNIQNQKIGKQNKSLGAPKQER